MRELALFAGGGGGILGGHLLGWKTICAVEINNYARSVLLARQKDGILPRFPIWDDITTFDGRPWKGRVDIVSGGFPCQDISVAGKGAGITGLRSGLWKEMSRVVCEVQPRFVYVENVPALTRRGLGVVLGDLAKMGYNARWCVLGANDAGAPHIRKRIWILAYTRNNKGRDGKSKSVRRNGRGEFQKEIRTSKAIKIARSSKTSRVISWWDIDPANLPDTMLSGLQAKGTKQQTTGVTGNDSQTDLSNTDEFYDDMGGFGASEVFKSEQTKVSECEISNSQNKRILLRKRSGTNDKRSRECRKDKRTDKEKHESWEWWPVESRLGRVAHGIPHRVDRLKTLGNAQVPAVAALAFLILSEGII